MNLTIPKLGVKTSQHFAINAPVYFCLDVHVSSSLLLLHIQRNLLMLWLLIINCIPVICRTQSVVHGRMVVCWTREQVVWGSIPCTRSYIEALCKLWIHIASAHPAVMGSWWNEKLILCEWHQLRKRCILLSETDHERVSSYTKEGIMWSMLNIT